MPENQNVLPAEQENHLGGDQQGPLTREMLFEIEREVLLRTASIRERLEEAEYHLARLNSYSWTRLGLSIDRGLQKVVDRLSLVKKKHERLRSGVNSLQTMRSERLSHHLRARDRAKDKHVAVFVDFDVPQLDRDAGSHNIFEMMRSLQYNGTIVKFWPDDQEGDAGHRRYLEASGIEVLSWPQRSFRRWVDENIDEIDVAVCARPDIALPYLNTLSSRAPSVARIYYGHDLHHRRMSMEAFIKDDSEIALAAERMKLREWATWREADVIAYPSEEEAALVEKMDPSLKAMSIVPFCFDNIRPANEPPQNSSIIFVAGFAHTPNVDGAVWLARHIFPLVMEACPSAKLLIAGSNPTLEVQRLQSSAITVTGSLTPGELDDLYAKARVAVVPLRFGAGVKLKVVEALQRGLPLVTTPVGVQGLPGAEEIVIVSEDIHIIAAGIVNFLLHDDIWRLSAGRQQAFAQERFARQRSVAAMGKLMTVALARAAERTDAIE